MHIRRGVNGDSWVSAAAQLDDECGLDAKEESIRFKEHCGD